MENNNSQLMEYKCPCCGGKIEFDSTLQKMKCPYCDTEFEMETLQSYDDALKEDRPDDLQWEDTGGDEWHEGETDDLRVYVCKSCGGEIVTDTTTAATHCPYCGNPVIMSGQFSGDLRPDFVIPFKLDKKAAKEQLTKHLSDKKLLPKAFRTESHIDEVKGVYVPVWLYDAGADANIRYKGTKVRSWSDAFYSYTETSYFAVMRAGTLSFSNVPVDGSGKMANDLMESIEPYDFSEAVDFQTAYLSGYFADRYDVSSEESIARANERIKRSAEDAFRSTVSGFSSVTVENSSVRLNNSKAKYALYPVWLLNTTWQGQNYVFAMNGQTGKFVGNLPCDKSAMFKYWLMYTGIWAAVICGVITLFNVL